MMLRFTSFFPNSENLRKTRDVHFVLIIFQNYEVHVLNLSSKLLIHFLRPFRSTRHAFQLHSDDHIQFGCEVMDL